jgi:outer membrane protein insertion porin family
MLAYRSGIVAQRMRLGLNYWTTNATTNGMGLSNLRALSLLGWWLVLLAPTNANAGYPVVAQIRIEGNQRVEKDAILIHIEQEAGQPLDNGVVNWDIRSVFKLGFFSSVSAHVVYIEGKPVLVYTVRERPQVIELRVEGMKALSPTDPRVVQAIKIHDGYILDPIAVRETIENLKSLYKDEGYINAQVTFAPVPRPNNTAIATFKVTETPQQ